MSEFQLSGSLVQNCLVGIVVGLVVYWYFNNRKYNMPPGPLALPLLGNYLQLGSDSRYYIKFYEWSKKYGPVISVGLGPVTLVVVNDLETAMEVLVKKSTDFAGRTINASIQCITYGCKDITFSQYGPTWKLHRQISSKALRQYMRGHALDERIHTALQTTLCVLNEQKGAFNPQNVINYLVINIILGLLFNGKYEYGNKELLHVIEKCDELNEILNSSFVPEDMFPFLKYVCRSKTMQKFVDLSKELLDDFIGKKYSEAKKTYNKDNIRHFADALLLAREEAEQEEGDRLESLSDDHLIQTIADIFFAGLNTTRDTLHFAILHMVAFPDIQKKVQEELDREIGVKRLPEVADRPKLSYTEAVLHESMRFATVVPTGIPHKTMCDTDIKGYKLPKDTIVMINHWALHNDPNAWDEVGKFKPERYLDEKGRLGPKPDNWLPFSAGKRGCLGEFVAKPELHLLFAGLMQQISWRAAEGVNVDVTPQGTIFVAYPKSYKVIVSRRAGLKE